MLYVYCLIGRSDGVAVVELVVVVPPRLGAGDTRSSKLAINYSTVCYSWV